MDGESMESDVDIMEFDLLLDYGNNQNN